MKLRILSDLHNEFSKFAPPKIETDVVVLAGDLHNGVMSAKFILDNFKDKPVVFVAGNHEYYSNAWPKLRDKLAKKFEGTNVAFLDRESIVIDGVRFLGATLWTDFACYGESAIEAAKEYAAPNVSDFSVIHNSDTGKLITPEDTRLEHWLDRNWLKENLEQSFPGPTIVVTHHAPSSKSCHPRFMGSRINPCFYSNMDSLVTLADVWVHGHAHDTYNYKMGNCQVICNPRGYPGEDAGFRCDLVFDLKGEM